MSLAADDIAEIHRRICRLYGASRCLALLYINRNGRWFVGRMESPKDAPICRRFDEQGFFAGAFTDAIGFDELRDAIAHHMEDIRP